MEGVIEPNTPFIQRTFNAPEVEMWHLIAGFRRPGTNIMLSHLYPFP
jgi:hypothetical protein